jgi:hypothetical protein
MLKFLKTICMEVISPKWLVNKYIVNWKSITHATLDDLTNQ